METVTGEVATQSSVPRKIDAAEHDDHGSGPLRRELRADAGEEERRGEQHHGEHVVRAPLDVPPGFGRTSVGGGLEARRLHVGGETVLRQLKGGQRRVRVVRGRVAAQASKAGLNSGRNRAR